MIRDFHLYAKQDAGGACLTFVMDLRDPAKSAVLKAMSEAFNKAGRPREADECTHAIQWLSE